jgi:hypothetical protein
MNSFTDIIAFQLTHPLENGILMFCLGLFLGNTLTDDISIPWTPFIRASTGIVLWPLMLILQEHAAKWASSGGIGGDPLLISSTNSIPKQQQRHQRQRHRHRQPSPITTTSILSSENIKPSSTTLPKTTSSTTTIPPLPKTTPQEQQAISIIFDRYFNPNNSSSLYHKTRLTIVRNDGMEAAYRALVARKWNIEKTSLLIDNMIKWREKEKVDDIFLKIVPDEHISQIRKCMSDGFSGQDKEGYPTYWGKLGLMNLSRLKGDVGLDSLITYHIQVAEFNQRSYYARFPSPHPHQITAIVDLKGFGPSSISGDFWSCMSAVTTIDADNYYECFHKVLILNAPGFFRFFWRTASSLLQPETREKFIVLKQYSELLQYLNENQIPIEWGGTYSGLAVATNDGLITDHMKEMDQYMKNERMLMKKS